MPPSAPLSSEYLAGPVNIIYTAVSRAAVITLWLTHDSNIPDYEESKTCSSGKVSFYFALLVLFFFLGGGRGGYFRFYSDTSIGDGHGPWPSPIDKSQCPLGCPSSSPDLSTCCLRIRNSDYYTAIVTSRLYCTLLIITLLKFIITW